MLIKFVQSASNKGVVTNSTKSKLIVYPYYMMMMGVQHIARYNWVTLVHSLSNCMFCLFCLHDFAVSVSSSYLFI